MKTELILESQKLNLYRFPKRKNESLQAWNAADEYLIYEALKNIAITPNVLILNDSFGALGCALAIEKDSLRLTISGDSYLSQLALLQNSKLNNIPHDSFEVLNSLDRLSSDIECVVLKLPKSQAFLEHQLIQMTRQLKQGTKIIAAAMSKDIHNSTLKLFEKYIGPTQTSLAKKKARLIFSSIEQDRKESPYPKSWELEIDEKILKIENQANVFSLNGLDQGARFMIENLAIQKPEHIIDVGCGNGILGLVASSFVPEATVSFVDESFMAVSSAKNNWIHNYPERPAAAQFMVDNCLQSFADNDADLILCNPPFHQQQAITDHIAVQMFSDSARVLKKGGQLLVIGNRHLGYHVKLKKWFKEVVQVAASSKFVIFSASN